MQLNAICMFHMQFACLWRLLITVLVIYVILFLMDHFLNYSSMTALSISLTVEWMVREGPVNTFVSQVQELKMATTVNKNQHSNEHIWGNNIWVYEQYGAT